MRRQRAVCRSVYVCAIVCLNVIVFSVFKLSGHFAQVSESFCYPKNDVQCIYSYFNAPSLTIRLLKFGEVALTAELRG